MTSTETLPHISRRYRLLEEIGSGGMGVVYRALDRLTGEEIALKQVTHADDYFDDIGSDNTRLTLAREFRLLASLRHPGVISVLDYGFSADLETLGLPYYTMEYLPDAKHITEAIANKSEAARVEMLGALLEALVYIHRRDILHRDLKPGNVLVVGDRLCVVDFGLSSLREHVQAGVGNDARGTLAYMAPEVLNAGDQFDITADLYAVGVIAFEIFAGQHPFPTHQIRELLYAIARGDADFSQIKAAPELVRMIRRLMRVDPRHRYHSAQEALDDLWAFSGKPVSRVHIATTRESFLQAARFVGREREFATLCKAVEGALHGEGGAWRVSGESGVGKTRLLQEVRAYAMVRGATVLTGQAISEEQVYGPWRDVLRRLSLSDDLNDAEASIFKLIAPDIERLLERPVADPPATKDASTTQANLLDAVRSVLHKLTRRRENPRFGDEAQTFVIVLEDCHWASSASLNLLKRLSEGVTDAHLLFIASDRSDHPDSQSVNLPGFQLLRLGRLDDRSIADLSESMLGDVGRQKSIVDLLERETEGNVFFMVEVVRTLAEEAGGNLEEIATRTIPQSVYAGSVMKVVHERLSTVPHWAHPLLNLAAVTGRYVDFEVLSALDQETDIDHWLTACAARAVLEVDDSGSARGRWRFAHDKLREALLNDLNVADRRKLHLEIAQTIERVHADQLPAYATHLAYHWQQYGSTLREFGYAILAGKRAIASGANLEAERYFQRTLDLFDVIDKSKLQGDPRRTLLEILIGLGVSKMAVRGYAAPGIMKIFDRARALTDALGINHRTLPVLTIMSGFYIASADFENAKEIGEAMVDLGRRLDHPTGELRGQLTVGEAVGFQGDFATADKLMRHVIGQYDPSRRRADSALQDFGVTAYEMLGVIRWIRGYADEARELGLTGLGIARQINHPISVVFALHWTGIIYFLRGEHQEALELAELTVEYAHNHDFKLFHILGRLYEAICETARDENKAPALSHLQQALAAYRATGARFCLPYFMAQEAQALTMTANSKQALVLLNQAFEVANRQNEHWFTPELHRLRGEVIRLHTNHLHAAEQEFLRGVALARKQDARGWELRATMSLLKVWNEQGRGEEGRAMLRRIFDSFTEGYDTQDLLDARNLLDESG